MNPPENDNTQPRSTFESSKEYQAMIKSGQDFYGSPTAEFHTRISEGQLDERVANPKGRPVSEVLPLIMELVELNGMTLPPMGEIRSHEAKTQIQGLLNVLKCKVARRDPQRFDEMVELLKECIGYHLTEVKEPVRPKWLSKGSGERDEEEERVEQSDCQTYVIDSKGNYWKWNMGWVIWDVKNRKARNRPIGHLAFSRIPKATRLELNVRTVQTGARPYGEWRRWVADHTIGKPTLYWHEVYKHVKVLVTDGVHAIVQNYYDPEMPRHEVMFGNLTELKMAETKHSMVRKDKKARKEKEGSSQITVEITDDFLKDLLN